MKNFNRILGGTLVTLLVVIPAYAAMETAGIETPAKTLADFQIQYSGTKPMIAWNKYQEYKTIQNVPRPTLEVSRMRIEPLMVNQFAGTKPAVGFTRKHQAKEIAPFVGTREAWRISYLSGTKPVVAFLRKS